VTVTTGDGLEPFPKKPMMYQEEVGLALVGRVDGGLTRVNGGDQPGHFVGSVDLQAV
jgi:hypothetical protein